jgi:hypothetical protein
MEAIVASTVKTKNTRFQETLLDLFASHPVPFSLIESPKFQRLFEIYNINLPIKNRHSLSTKLKERGFEIEQKVKDLLNSDECISLHLQLDLWQSPSDRGHYISLIGSFVDSSYSFQEVLLSFSKFSLEHSGEQIANAIMAVLVEYNVASKILAVTTDSAANNIRMMTYLQELLEERRTSIGRSAASNEISWIFDENTWFHCISHVLHLVAIRLLQSNAGFQAIMIKVRKVASIIRLSDPYRTKFQAICENWKLSFTKPPGEVVTRWNATYELLIWFLTFKFPIVEFLRTVYGDASENIKRKMNSLGAYSPGGVSIADDVDLVLNKREWAEIQLMKSLLKPFYSFTQRFNRCISVSSDALVCYFYLIEYIKDIEECFTAEDTTKFFMKHRIESTFECLPEGYRLAAEAASAKLEKYVKRSDLVDYFYLTNLLDPRFRTSMIDSNLSVRDARNIIDMCHAKVLVIEDIISSFEQGGKESPVVQMTEPGRVEADESLEYDDTFDNMVLRCVQDKKDGDVSNSRNKFDSVESEWEFFTSSKDFVRSTQDFNPLSYWKRESDRLPRLAKIARVVFAFAATSTSCERSFSLTRNILAHRRHRLSPLTIQHLISSQYNSRLFNSKTQDNCSDIQITTHASDEDLDASDHLGTNVDVGSVFSKALNQL